MFARRGANRSILRRVLPLWTGALALSLVGGALGIGSAAAALPQILPQCAGFTASLPGSSITGNTVIPASQATGKTLTVTGQWASFAVNLDTLAVNGYTVNDMPLYDSVTAEHASPLVTDVTVEFEPDKGRIRIERRAADMILQVQADDCDLGSVLQVSPDLAPATVRHQLAAGAFYGEQQGLVLLFGGPQTGFEGPDELGATLVSHDAGTSEWSVPAGGAVQTTLRFLVVTPPPGDVPPPADDPPAPEDPPASTPEIRADVSPQPNALGWNNSATTVGWRLRMPDGSTPSLAEACPTVTLDTETSGTVLSCETMVGEQSLSGSVTVQIDLTAPATEGSPDTGPNANGWYRSSVTVSLTASDNLSGVARTEYNLDGNGWAAYSGPISVSGEGTHSLQYRSKDKADNVEETESLTIKIDMTAPEAILRFEPSTGDLVVLGQDTLSGPVPGPVAPDAGGVPSLRTYVVTDLAGNVTTLTVAVATRDGQIDASIVGLSYNGGPAVSLAANSTSYRWAYASDGTLQRLEQKLKVDDAGQRLEAGGKYDSNKGATEFEIKAGAVSSRTVEPGLVLLGIATSGGLLQIQAYYPA